MSTCDKIHSRVNSIRKQQDDLFRKHMKNFGQHIIKLPLLVFIVGMVLFLATNSSTFVEEKREQRHGRERRQTNTMKLNADPCEFSAEAKRAGLPSFLDAIKWAYIRSFPFITLYRSELTIGQMREAYRPYVPYPGKLKTISDTSLFLARKLKNLKINKALLKIRERRMLSLAKHFLENHFGSPYTDNYYAGTWMSGPGRSCTAEGIAYVRLQVATIFLLFPPGNIRVLEQIFASLQETGRGVRQYIQNIKRGINTGMINSREDCLAGIKCLQSVYPGFGNMLDGTKVLDWIHPNSFVFNMTNFLRFLTSKPRLVQQWKLRFNSTFAESMRRILVLYVGRPLDELIHFLKSDHLLYCVPEGVIHGLGSRPVPYVYYNGSRTNQTTLPYMDTGEIMNGKTAYGQVLSYFTTLALTPDQINKIGWEMIGQLYPRVIQIAQNMTGIRDPTKAVWEFKQRINKPDIFLNKDPFPANESDDRAHEKCSQSTENAKRFCPVRYATMQKWFKVARDSIAHIDPKVKPLFYHTGPKKTTPSCAIDVQMSLDPSEAVQSYESAEMGCESPAHYNIPFFVDRMGPKYAEWSISAHEASPGHHLQMQGHLENFRDTCASSLDMLTNQQFTAFAEGWAMYAENPLASIDMELFKNNQLERYGLLKTQLWRALRLVIDTGLHHRDMSRNEAVTLFRKYLWETGDVPEKEVKRYQSWAGQAATYMTGQLALWKMRNYAKRRLGGAFDIKEFHYQILRHGQVPIDFLEDHVRMFVDCVLRKMNVGCAEILGSPQGKPKQKKTKKLKRRELREKRILKIMKYLGLAQAKKYLF